MIDVEKQKEFFKDHVAKITEYGNIKILDFKNPKSSNYRIRFLFEEDYYRLHISGDLGELTASNYNNMTFEGFEDYVNNVSYFMQKIDCHSRNIYEYDEDKARTELKELINECECGDKILEDYSWCTTEEEAIDELIDDSLEYFSEDNGMSSSGFEAISEYVCDFWEIVSRIGRTYTGILDLYMLAFKLAMEQIKVNSSQL